MFGIPIENLTESDIQQLVDSHALESQHLDFKAKLPCLIDTRSKGDFCEDIAAFANATGGDLVYGISDKANDTTGAKSSDQILGVEVENADELIRKITDIVRNGVEPRGQDVRVRVILFANGKRVVVVRVPESLSKPLMAVEKRSWKIRTNNKNSDMQYNQIKSSFLNSANQAEQIRSFREQRKTAILSNDSIAPYCGDKLIVYHFIPKPSYDQELELDLSLYSKSVLRLPACNRITSGLSRATMDGFAFFGTEAGRTEPLFSKTEIFHSGTIEMVDALTLQHGNELNLDETQAVIRKAITDAHDVMSRINVTCRVSFFLTILNIEGMRLWTDPYDPRQREFRACQKNLDFPEYVLEPNQEIEPLINATLLRLRNAFGLPG